MRKKRQREEKLRLKKKNESQNLRKMLFFLAVVHFLPRSFLHVFIDLFRMFYKFLPSKWEKCDDNRKGKNAEKIETDEERSAFFVNVGVFFRLIDFPAYSSHVFRMFYAF